MMLVMTSYGQTTDYTSRIQNPSFEQGTDGWEHKQMSAQSNNVFSIKAGNTYMEKWTGRGGAVGDALLSQEIRNLPAGKYVLTAAAQNIQEDTPTTARAADDKLYPAGGGAKGRDVYSTLIIAENAYGVTDIEGGGLQHIVKQLGSAGTADPLNQRATVGWKAIKTAEILVQPYMIRIESVSSFNDTGAN